MLSRSLSAHSRLQEWLQGKLGPEMAVVCTDVREDPSSLWPVEQAAVAKAVPKRRSEFASGRAAARLAMKQLGMEPMAIPMQPNRCPAWPAHLVGSISHTNDACVVALGPTTKWQSIGLDLELNVGIEEENWDLICSRAEYHGLLAMPAAQRSLAVTGIFVAKEAFYKWQFPLTELVLDFQDVEVNLEKRAFAYRGVECASFFRKAAKVAFDVVHFEHWVMAWVATRNPTHSSTGPD